MTSCLLIYPKPTKDSPLKETALSIFYLGAYLEERGINVEYVDERYEEAESFNFDAVAVSTMTGFQLSETKRILLKAKAANPNIITVVGGVHPTLFPRECLEEDFIDYVVMREGEETLHELLLGKAPPDIKGLAWRDGDRIEINSPRPFLKELPFPMTKKSKHYFQKGNMAYITSKGCVGNCNFCYNQIFNQRSWRPQPIEKIEEDIKRFKQELNFNSMFLVDDNIGANKQRIREIGKIMKHHNIKWHVNIRCDYIDDEMAQILEEGNCESLLLGVESGSERILREVINKGHGVKSIIRCANALANTNIKGIYSFIYNIPTETKEEQMMSFNLADKIKKINKNAVISFYTYTAYPGTKLYDERPKSFDEWGEVNLTNSNLYYISGLTFRKDRTSQNFPGLKRLKILPFELLCMIRWKFRYFNRFSFERKKIEGLIEGAAG